MESLPIELVQQILLDFPPHHILPLVTISTQFAIAIIHLHAQPQYWIRHFRIKVEALDDDLGTWAFWLNLPNSSVILPADT
jgi:hypothetical protein